MAETVTSTAGDWRAPHPPRGRADRTSAGRRAAVLAIPLLAAYTLLLAFLLRPAGGLEGSYLTRGPDGREILTHRRIDPRLDFPIPQRIDAAYLDHWDLKRDGYP